MTEASRRGAEWTERTGLGTSAGKGALGFEWVRQCGKGRFGTVGDVGAARSVKGGQGKSGRFEMSVAALIRRYLYLTVS